MAQKRQEADRSPLTRQRVLDAAIALADRVGIEPFTIRKLAAELERMAGWLGLSGIVVEPRGDLAGPLAAAVAAR